MSLEGCATCRKNEDDSPPQPCSLTPQASRLGMDPQLAIDISRDALFMTSVIAAPVLISGVVVGLIIGLLQALTQIQEQTVAFVPKLVAMGVALAITLPWILAQMLDYSDNLLRSIPSTL